MCASLTSRSTSRCFVGRRITRGGSMVSSHSVVTRDAVMDKRSNVVSRARRIRIRIDGSVIRITISIITSTVIVNEYSYLIKLQSAFLHGRPCTDIPGSAVLGPRTAPPISVFVSVFAF